MNFYDQSAETALALIKQFGTSIPVKRLSNTPDPVAGTVVQTETVGSLVAVVLPAKATALSLAGGNADNAVTEALTKGKIRFVLAAAKGAPFVPDADDVLTIEEASWRVMGCTPLAPAGIPVVFKIGAMRA